MKLKKTINGGPDDPDNDDIDTITDPTQTLSRGFNCQQTFIQEKEFGLLRLKDSRAREVWKRL